MVQGILAYRKLREEAVTLHHWHPDYNGTVTCQPVDQVAKER